MSTMHHLKQLERKRYLAGLLEIACQELDIPPSKWEAAQKAYKAVGEWLNECPTLGQWHPLILPQGAAAHGTLVKPVSSQNFDIDLVCHLRRVSDASCHVTVKRLVGVRVKEYEKRGPKCSEYKRCWRLDYAEGSQMHLDITPAVNHTTSPFGSLAVPDKELKCWHESNPPGYADLFNKIAAKQPVITGEIFELSVKAANSAIKPLPDQTPLRGYLRRTVQLLKRHRSVYFQMLKRLDEAPISIIISTLAMRAYARIISERRTYDSEFDVVCDIIRLMPEFIERTHLGEWRIMNDTTVEENFAEKWNKPGSRLSHAFYEWHGVAVSAFDGLAAAPDSVSTSASFDRIVGTQVGSTVRSNEQTLISTARHNQAISVSPRGTLSTAAGIVIPSNTFFGA